MLRKETKNDVKPSRTRPARSRNAMSALILSVIVLSAIMLSCLVLDSAIAYPPIAAEFYGVVLINLSVAPAGTNITAYDPDGVLCGSFQVVNEGYFGLLSCNGDDVSTAADEGASDGENITFYINDLPTRRFYNFSWESAEFKFVYVDVNYRPVLIIDDEINSTEDILFYYDVNASDPNNDNLSFSSNSTLFSIGSDTGIISFTPTNDDVGVYDINFTVSDPFGLGDSRIVTFTVINVNDRPFFDPPLENQSVNARDLFYYDINASDIDVGDSLTYFINSTFFDISPTTGIINYTIQDEDIGNYTFLVRACDDSGAWNNCTNGTFSLVILFSNHMPEMTHIGDKAVYAGIPFSFDVNATDADNDTLTFFTNSSIFSIDSQSGMIAFTPTDDLVGTYSIKIWVTDDYYNVSEIISFVILPELYCGDGQCSSLISETCYSCPEDCGVCPEGSVSDNPGDAAGGGSEGGEGAEESSEGDVGETGIDQSQYQGVDTGTGQKGLSGSADQKKTIICYQNWTCGDWGECISGIQTRECVDKNNCTEKKSTFESRGVPFDIVYAPIPPESRECEMPPSCDDGIQNQGEEGIDCGGPCEPCSLVSITKYAKFPFIERPYRPGCGDGICSLGEECYCMKDCKTFPKEFFIGFGLMIILLFLISSIVDYIGYKIGLYKKGKFFIYFRRILFLFIVILFILLVFTLYLYLYGSCSYILKKLLFLPIGIIIIIPMLIYILLARYGYLESRKRRILKRLEHSLEEDMVYLQNLEDELMSGVEKEAVRKIFRLYDDKDDIIKAFPQLIHLYNLFIKKVRHIQTGMDPVTEDKEIRSSITNIIDNKGFKETSAGREDIALLDETLKKILDYLNEKSSKESAIRQLKKKIDEEASSETADNDSAHADSTDSDDMVPVRDKPLKDDSAGISSQKNKINDAQKNKAKKDNADQKE